MVATEYGYGVTRGMECVKEMQKKSPRAAAVGFASQQN
jgi:hypothetical protein